MRRCAKCVMPETWSGITFNEDGVCSICIETEKEVKLDWSARERQLKEILEHMIVL